MLIYIYIIIDNKCRYNYISLFNSHELDDLMQKAKEVRGDDKKVITYSKKVFIPFYKSVEISVAT